MVVSRFRNNFYLVAGGQYRIKIVSLQQGFSDAQIEQMMSKKNK